MNNRFSSEQRRYWTTRFASSSFEFRRDYSLLRVVRWSLRLEFPFISPQFGLPVQRMKLGFRKPRVWSNFVSSRWRLALLDLHLCFLLLSVKGSTVEQFRKRFGPREICSHFVACWNVWKVSQSRTSCDTKARNAAKRDVSWTLATSNRQPGGVCSTRECSSSKVEGLDNKLLFAGRVRAAPPSLLILASSLLSVCCVCVCVFRPIESERVARRVDVKLLKAISILVARY